MILTSEANSFQPCREVSDTLFTATSRFPSARTPLYTDPKPPLPSLRSSEKFPVAAASSS